MARLDRKESNIKKTPIIPSKFRRKYVLLFWISFGLNLYQLYIHNKTGFDNLLKLING